MHSLDMRSWPKRTMYEVSTKKPLGIRDHSLDTLDFVPSPKPEVQDSSDLNLADV